MREAERGRGRLTKRTNDCQTDREAGREIRNKRIERCIEWFKNRQSVAEGD